MIKIYFDNKALYLAQPTDAGIRPILNQPGSQLFESPGNKAIRSLVECFSDEDITTAVITDHSIDQLRSNVFDQFKIIAAGGGIVLNDENKILMIFRRGKWDLPKGKLDPGETIEACAIREVKEETALDRVSIIRPLIVTYHTYRERSKMILKESHWFLMKARGNQQLIPQTEEDIEKLEWVDQIEIAVRYDECFPSVVDVLQEYLSDPISGSQ